MYGISWKRLAEYNSLSNPDRLVVGQEIRVPRSYNAAPSVRPSSFSMPTSSRPISEGTSYVIERGDTLSGIAKRAGVTVAELKAANALSSNRIIAGKSITVPKKGAVVTIEVPSEPAPDLLPVTLDVDVPELAPMVDLMVPVEPVAVEPVAAAAINDHVLYPGESLEDVARQYGCSQEEIMLLNGITDPTAIKPGMKLLVPMPD